jgi:glycosyltransferase involved in cell wall biosynthesis
MPSDRRVLHVITGLDVGGAETALVRLVRATPAWRSRVFSILPDGALVADVAGAGAPVDYLRRGDAASGPSGLGHLASVCREFQPDVVVGWMYHGIALAAALRVAGCTRAPVVWNIRCTLDGRRTWSRSTNVLLSGLARTSRWASSIVYNSQRGLEQHVAFGFAEGRHRVIPNGLDLQALAADAGARADVRAELGIPPSAVVVGHVGRFDPMKGHAAFLQAIARVDVHRELHVVMAGRHVTAGNPALQGPARAAAERAKIHMLGERRDVPRVMNAFDVLCMSSNSNEGFPNVVAEAMACQVPCVVTRAGDAEAIVGPTGRVVEIGDLPALAEALRDLISLKPAERSVLGIAARARVVERFSVERMALAYDSLFASLGA